jgi:uncharacterized protein YjbI with pentapeptide repeats/MinD-like ATPase involved in chromosome partitioning or flagellar assembly
MKVLAVTSGKGGVGKTTLALNIARQLSLHGQRTLIVDFDIHNKGTTGLFLDKVGPSSPSIISIVEGSKRFDHARTTALSAAIEPLPLTNDGLLLLLPASRPDEMISWRSFHGPNDPIDEIVTFFRPLFEQLTSRLKIDVVVIDCYGGIDSLTVAAAGIADDTIIVNEPDVITFSGTLLLYKYLCDTYAASARKPSIHFVINRITSRHSFCFLDSEYQKHLCGLSIRNSILAYLHYDKLVMETFGDYPFFTELLPRSLITKKIRLLIRELWPEHQFEGILRVSPRKEKKIYRATSETRFADPERIIRSALLAPFFLMVPVGILTLLILQPVASLPYRWVRLPWSFAILMLAVILCFVLIFEPIQIARWSLRIANYTRRKRALQKRMRRPLRYLMSAGAYCRAVPAALLSLLMCVGMVSTVFEKVSSSQPFYRDISIWEGAVSGFKAGGHYGGLRMSYGSRVDAKNSTFENADLSNARLSGVTLTGVSLIRANLSHANLSFADLSGAHLSSANLEGATLMGTKFSGAELPDANLVGAILMRADLSGANLSDANLVGASLMRADLSGANLSDANLVGASLVEADLSTATLSRAILCGADLDGAKFGQADLLTANLRGVKNWQNIKSMNLANIHNVQSPPDGFLDWWVTQKKEAVYEKDGPTWKRWLAAVASVDEGRRLATRGEIKEAIAAFEEARKQDRDVELYPGLGSDPQAVAYWLGGRGWQDRGREFAQRGEAVDSYEAYAKAANVLKEGLSVSPNDESLLESLGAVYYDHLFKYEAAYECYKKVVVLKPDLKADTVEYWANFAEACLAVGHFEEANTSAQGLLTKPAVSRVLTPDEELAMRLVVISSLVLQKRTGEVDGKMKEFISRYNSVADEYEPRWVYKGTRNFITNYPKMDKEYKKILLKLIEFLETPAPSITTEQIGWRTATTKVAK